MQAPMANEGAGATARAVGGVFCYPLGPNFAAPPDCYGVRTLVNYAPIRG
jgi:hypothetical protein